MSPSLRKYLRAILARTPRLKAEIKRILIRWRGSKAVSLKVLGTSNAIISTGYFAALRQIEGVEIVANLSVGSCHASLVPIALSQDDPKQKSDVFLLDLCVNEQRAASRNLYNIEISEIALEHFLDYCAKTWASPLVLLLPQMNDQGELSLDAVKRWKRLCRQKRVPYVDVYRISQKHGLARYLWKDPNHPNALFSSVIADEIASKARKLVLTRRKPKWAAHEFYYFVNFPGTKVKRSTSLMTKDFAQFSEGDTFEVSLPDQGDFEVFGVALNMAQTHAAIKYQGAKSITQRFDNAYYDPARSLWYVIWSSPQPISSKDGRLTITIVEPADDGLQLKNDHIDRPLSKSLNRKTILEIETLILRKC